MKATIILFSPSGNTLNVGMNLKNELEKEHIETQLLNLTGDSVYFKTENRVKFLQSKIQKHDILLVGAPVYAHHFQYHMKELIEALPWPDEMWGQTAVPFVTYGGINSGIALDEAGKLLVKRGRKIMAGLKIASSHRMTRAFLPEELNSNLSEERLIDPIKELITRIKSEHAYDYSAQLCYQNEEAYHIANHVFEEKRCHQVMYPQVIIDDSKCRKCGLCIKSCPVCHLQQNESGKIIFSSERECIHCFNCVISCDKNAISLQGDIEKAKEFFKGQLAKGMEKPQIAVYPMSTK